MARKVDVIFC
jgi:hypothetical protein